MPQADAGLDYIPKMENSVIATLYIYLHQLDRRTWRAMKYAFYDSHLGLRA